MYLPYKAIVAALMAKTSGDSWQGELERSVGR
jgi:hypothetical protein